MFTTAEDVTVETTEDITSELIELGPGLVEYADLALKALLVVAAFLIAARI